MIHDKGTAEFFEKITKLPSETLQQLVGDIVEPLVGDKPVSGADYIDYVTRQFRVHGLPIPSDPVEKDEDNSDDDTVDFPPLSP
jgi:hypothetical protein